MSRYINIATRVWHDEKFRELPDDAKMLFMYLLSSPHSNMCGLYYLPPYYAYHDLNWDEDRYLAAAEALCNEGLVIFKENVLLIVNFLRYNPIRGPKQAVGAARRLNEVPANSLVGKFLEILEANTEPEDYQKFLDTLSIPYSQLTDTLSIPEYRVQSTESDTDTEDILSFSPQKIVDIYNQTCTSMPKVRTVTDKRRRIISTRGKKYKDIAIYEELFKKAEASDFLSGRNGKWANCNFDWLMKEDNMVKTLEGNYDNKRAGVQGPGKL